MCGNLGLLAAIESANDEKTAAELLRAMAALTELRGALGGGLAATNWIGRAAPTHVAANRVRVVPGKREVLSDELIARFQQNQKKGLLSSCFGGPEEGPRILGVIGHTRYPTSSRTSEPELHPHIWTPHHMAPSLWFSDRDHHDNADSTVDTPALPTLHSQKPTLRGIYLSHNGDFDEYDLFGQRVSYVTVGKWLSRVLHCPNDLNGDSPKIAGMLEFLAAKGSWDYAVRLAYQKAVASGPGDAAAGDNYLLPSAANTAPTPAWCSAMGSRFEVLWIEALEARDKNQLALDLARSGDPLGGDNTMNGSSKSGSSSAHPFAAMSIGEEGDDDASASSHASSLEGGPSSSGLVANTSSPANHPSGADVNFSVENGPYGGGNPTYSSGGGSNSGSSGSGSSSYGGTGGGATLHGLAPPSADALFETRFVATCIAAAASWASEDERVGTWPKNKREAFVQTAVDKFLRADLFAALSEFVSHAHGSFGLQAISSSEPHTVAISAKGQSMRLAVAPAANVALWGSEGSAVEVPVPGGGARFLIRLNSLTGQSVETSSSVHGSEYLKTGVVELRRRSPSPHRTGASNSSHWAPPGHATAAASASAAGGPRCLGGAHSVGWDQFALRSYGVQERCLFAAPDLQRMFRPFVPPRSLVPSFTSETGPQPDEVLRDLRAIPAVLDLIVGKWREGIFSMGSLNRRSAAAFVEKFALALNAIDSASSDKVHLLVVGVEVSLWVAEQFAADVTEFLPGASATAVSANQLVGGEKVYFSARDSKGSLSLSALSEAHTVVLVLSQSGQTFPALKATARLCARLGDRVFIMVGGHEEAAPFSEMGSVVMDHHRTVLGRDGSDRVFCTLSGPRPCEPSSLAVVAAHHSLTELLVYTRLAFERQAAEMTSTPPRPQEPQEPHPFAAAAAMSGNSGGNSGRNSGGDSAGGGSGGNGGLAVGGGSSGGGPDGTTSLSMSSSSGARARRAELLRANFREAVVALTAPSLRNIADIVGADAHGVLNASAREVDASLRHASPWSGLSQCFKVRDHGLWSSQTDKDPLGNNGGGNGGAGQATHRELVAIGQRWGRHFSEPWRVLFLTGTYVAVTVTFGVPLARLLLRAVLALATAGHNNSNDDDVSASKDGTVASTLGAPTVCWSGVSAYLGEGAAEVWALECPVLPVLLGTLVAALDAAIYVFFPIYAARFLRRREGRPIKHRFGKRTVVVADVPWVGKCTEAYSSKLFSLAYSFAGPDVHCGDPVDDLVHKFAHRSVRGLLVAVGRPDGRLFAFTKTETAVLLSCKQMSFVENLGSNPEVVSVGSNPHFEPRHVLTHVALPSQGRPKFIDEFVYSQMYERQKQFPELPGSGGSAALMTPRKYLQKVRKALRAPSHGGPFSTQQSSNHHPFGSGPGGGGGNHGNILTYGHGGISGGDGVLGLDDLLSNSIDISASMNDSSSGRFLRYPNMTSAQLPGATGGSSNKNSDLSRQELLKGTLDSSGRGVRGLDASGKASGRGTLDTSGRGVRGLDGSGKASGRGNLDNSGRGYRGLDNSGRAASGRTSNKSPVGLLASLEYSGHGLGGGSATTAPRRRMSGDASPQQQQAMMGDVSGEPRSSNSYSDEMGVLKASSSLERFAPSETSAFQANLDDKTGRFLARFTLSQRLLEARFNSLERFVSFCVIFHAAAETTNAGLWGLPHWDWTRSQAHMRVNTTACPVLDGDSGDDQQGHPAMLQQTKKSPGGGATADNRALAHNAGNANNNNSPSLPEAKTNSLAAAGAEMDGGHQLPLPPPVAAPLLRVGGGGGQQQAAQSSEALSLLRRVRVLAHLPLEMLESLAVYCTPASFLAGSCLVGQGDLGDSLVLVADGTAVVLLANPRDAQAATEESGPVGHEVSRLGPGDCFGEPSILRDESSEAYVQPASIVAVTGVRCWVLRRDHFRDVLLADNSDSNQSSVNGSIDLSSSSGAAASFGRNSSSGGGSSSEANLEMAPTGMDRSLRGNIAPIREGVPEGEAAESLSPTAAKSDVSELPETSSSSGSYLAAASVSSEPQERGSSAMGGAGTLE